MSVEEIILPEVQEPAPSASEVKRPFFPEDATDANIGFHSGLLF
jgi:hypothetical protein